MKSRKPWVRFLGPDQYSGSLNNLEMNTLPLPHRWLGLRVARMTTYHGGPAKKKVSSISTVVLITLGDKRRKSAMKRTWKLYPVNYL